MNDQLPRRYKALFRRLTLPELEIEGAIKIFNFTFSFNKSLSYHSHNYITLFLLN